MTKEEWRQMQIETGQSEKEASRQVDLIHLLAHLRSGREIEDWLQIGEYIHAKGAA